MKTLRLTRSALCLMTAAAAACGTTTAPLDEPELDTDAALADYEALESVLASPEFVGFRALGARTPFGASVAGVDVVAGMTAPSEHDGGRAFAGRLAHALVTSRASRPGGPAGAPIISGLTRGKTFVYDPSVDDYRHAPERTEAPANGVRFIMYEVDEAGIPIVESEVGYADLLDEGDESVEDIVLRLMVVHGEDAVLDYRTTLDVVEGGGSLTVAGFMVGEGTRLDFNIEATGRETTEGERLDVGFELRVDSRDFSITGQVTGIDESNDDVGEIDVTVRHRTDSVRVSVTGSEGMIEGTVFVNGAVFATVSGPESEPVFLDAAGLPLTLGELLVLRHVFDVFEDVFDLLEDLIDPVDEIVILGIIL